MAGLKLIRVLLVVKENIFSDPVDINLFGSQAVMPVANHLSDLI